MKAVVHRGTRTREIESRVADAPALAKEWGGRGANVNAIAPGCVATDNTEALRADPQRNQAFVGRIPAGRWRRADDLPGATVFLAFLASDRVNGIALPVDGGWLGR
ncbi:SDR family oxidoreductase [Streptomyces sp. Go-475]|uniref:SDR family oxidoreductase n=1 Tax=Streptomyces sp. Go-475 TaxID=2072505 RepID=UPI000DEF6604|nr:SDR family oxidoreductase [Streptomyces sp. Go-475]AXE83871.1 2-dehydro-3-deoxy-D-gluconate 5-dehydrogenase [Streptomyces sp. Go-475]